MPWLWAYGSGALHEAEPTPNYEKVLINNDGGVAALQTYYDMYVRDKSVPTSALTNVPSANEDLFIAGELAMFSGHPASFAVLTERLQKISGADRPKAEEALGNMTYGLLPAGPVRRAVVFGGSNIHIFSDSVAERPVNRPAANGFLAFMCGPEWSLKLIWPSSNPGHLTGFKTSWMKERLAQIKHLEHTTAMLPYGVPFPVIPESPDIMNIIVPTMMQNALTGKMSVKQAADNAADEIKKLIAQRKE
jgi:multiple sugar transport system substrate-binding protein